MKKIEEESLSYTELILEEIKTGMYANANRLPAENELARQFGISRTLVRDSLSILEQEGFITRKQGIGTIVNHQVINAKNRIDLEEEFLDMVKSAGFNPGVKDIKTTIAESNYICDKLKVLQGTKLIKSIRTITADGRPAIYVEDYIAESLIRNFPYKLDESEKPIFHFLQKYCETDVYLDLSEIKAIHADEKVAERLNIKLDEAILYIDEIGYNLRGQPVLYSKEYYANGFFNHMILRKKI